MRRINADVVIALLLMVICAVFFVETFAYQKVHLAIIGSKLWPRVVVVAMFLLASAYRITSYNVCYTKLLRLLSGDSDHAWGEFLVERGLVDGSRYQRENDRYYEAYKAGELDIADYLRFALRPLRITSYNVCYTKLLRIAASPSCCGCRKKRWTLV